MASEKRLIDVNKEIKKIQSVLAEHPNEQGTTAYYAFSALVECLKKAPTVDAVEVVHGRWIYKWDADRDPKKLFVRIVCSECNLHTGQKSNYCPNCGAKMDGGNEDV